MTDRLEGIRRKWSGPVGNDIFAAAWPDVHWLLDEVDRQQAKLAKAEAVVAAAKEHLATFYRHCLGLDTMEALDAAVEAAYAALAAWDEEVVG